MHTKCIPIDNATLVHGYEMLRSSGSTDSKPSLIHTAVQYKDKTISQQPVNSKKLNIYLGLQLVEDQSGRQPVTTDHVTACNQLCAVVVVVACLCRIFWTSLSPVVPKKGKKLNWTGPDFKTPGVIKHDWEQVQDFRSELVGLEMVLSAQECIGEGCRRLARL